MQAKAIELDTVSKTNSELQLRVSEMEQIMEELRTQLASKEQKIVVLDKLMKEIRSQLASHEGKVVVEKDESDRIKNLSMINTELTAQLMNLTKEFLAYKETGDKMIADFEARMAGGGASGSNTPGGDSGQSTPNRGSRSQSPSRDVKRGATRLAKLGK